MTDFCVGVIVQPLLAVFLMEIASGKWRILYLILSIFNYTFCGFSFATATAISMDRLSALLLGLRYKHTNKTSSLLCCLLLASYNCNWFHILLLFSRLCQQCSVCCYHNFLVPLGLLSRQNLSQTATASSPTTTTCL